MAAMRPLRAFSLWSISPILLSTACRISPLLYDRNGQCATYSTSSGDTFSFKIAASFSAKGSRFDSKRDVYSYLPHTVDTFSAKNKRPNSGQDSFFVVPLGRSKDIAFGVADGVGGWMDSGVDPADFSHGLCEGMKEAARGTEEGREGLAKPGRILQKGYDDIVADESIPAGGSTACVAIGRADGILEVANLGDSGFVQLRPNAVYYSSDPQIHAFNTPYQLSIIPPQILARSRAFGGSMLMDMPSDASLTTHSVRHGDVLIFATDGLWDNLSAADVLKTVSRYMTGFHGWTSSSDTKGNSRGALEASVNLKNITAENGLGTKDGSIQALLAVAITSEAKMASMDTKRDGPFAREVHKYYPSEDFHGGKVDDICVVVAVVVKND